MDDPNIAAPATATPSAWLPWAVVLGLFALIGLTLLARWWNRRVLQTQIAQRINVSVATDSPAPVGQIGAASNDDRLTSRERRLEEIRRHLLATPHDNRPCLYCQTQATRAMPAFRLVRSVFDPLLRRMGVSRVDRWYIELDAGEHVICDRHHEHARGLMEQELAEVTTEGAAFMNKLRHRVHTYDTYELDEALLNNVQVIKRGKPRRAARVTLENIRQLKPASGDKSNG